MTASERVARLSAYYSRGSEVGWLILFGFGGFGVGVVSYVDVDGVQGRGGVVCGVKG